MDWPKASCRPLAAEARTPPPPGHYGPMEIVVLRYLPGGDAAKRQKGKDTRQMQAASAGPEMM
ncbi:MAG TPA: hypothetical protein PLL36_12385, partial [Candidatus Hydrogenedentes bacterium]|nr:hypothetical protein [Candidatus Hydrogenedentota bacterium]